MKKLVALISAIFILTIPFLCLAQESNKVKTSTLVWWGFKDKTSFAFVEGYQTRGRWIAPDIGWIDYGKPEIYREVFAGGGYIPISTKKFSLVTEGFFLQGTGTTRTRPNYLMPFIVSKLKPTSKLTWESSYFAYLPLNKPAQIQHVLDRSKLEWQYNNRFLFGGGYSGFITKNTHWESKPFISTTFLTKNYGNFEIWFQKMPPPYNYRFQLRFLKTH